MFKKLDFLLSSISLAVMSLVGVAFFAMPAFALADSIGPITFESLTYTLGSIQLQDGWGGSNNTLVNGGIINPAYDQAIVSTPVAYTGTFGAQSFRISDAVASGSFGDWIFSKPLLNEAGETSAVGGGLSGGTRQAHFETQFDFADDSTVYQPGMHLSVSPDRGDGSRMSYLRFEDQADGIHVFFDDVTDPSHVTNADTFNEVDIATLDRTVPHTIKLSMDFIDGSDNDVVNVYIDGVLKHTGTSWEDYYRFDSEQASGGNQVPTVDSLIFQSRYCGGACPTNDGDLGHGYLIDNLSLSSGPIPVVASVTTNPATAVGQTVGTVNGTNGPTPADNTSFWWGTTSAGPFIPSANPSSEFPSGWSHDGGLGSATGNQTFSNPLTGLTSGTTYYFVAWSLIGGTWYPGEVLSFNTAVGATPSVVTNSATGETMTTATLNGTNGLVDADNTSFWWGTSPIGSLTAMADPSSEFPATNWSHDSGLGSVVANAPFSGAVNTLSSGTNYYYVAWSHVGGVWYPGKVLSFTTPGSTASCPVGTIQASSPLETVSVNSSLPTPILSSNVLINGQSYILVSSGTWQNSSLNVADSAYASLDNWTSYMEGYDITPYLLGQNEFKLQVNNGFVNWGSYNTNHTYSYSLTGTGAPISLGVFDGDSNTNTANSGWYGDNTGNLSVAIYPCNLIVTTGTISGEKYNDLNHNGKKDANEPGLQGWKIRLLREGSHDSETLVTTATTDANGNYTFLNILPGTYDVRETHQKGWKRQSKNPKDIVIVAGSTVVNVDFGNAQIRKGEKEDGDNDDNHRDQQGSYNPGHGKKNYENDNKN